MKDYMAPLFEYCEMQPNEALAAVKMSEPTVEDNELGVG